MLAAQVCRIASCEEIPSGVVDDNMRYSGMPSMSMRFRTRGSSVLRAGIDVTKSALLICG